MYGCMALMTERFEEAETFFEAATCTESKSVVAWTMLGNGKFSFSTRGEGGLNWNLGLLGLLYLHWSRESHPGWVRGGGGW